MAAYDETKVGAARSQESIRNILKKYGVNRVQFTESWNNDHDDCIGVEFIHAESKGLEITRVIHVRIVGRPNPDHLVPSSRSRDPEKAKGELSEAERRRIFRVVFYYLKSKLEAIAEGLIDFEEGFLPHIVLSNGDTVWTQLKSDIHSAIDGKTQLALMGKSE